MGEAMSGLIAPAEVASLTATPNDVPHIVCHCTNYDVAWCRLDVSGHLFIADDEELDCPLCGLVGDERPDACPWDCSCDEC